MGEPAALVLALTVLTSVLMLDASAGRPMSVPFFALRRHHGAMKSGFGPRVETGSDAFGIQFLQKAMGRGRQVPAPRSVDRDAESDEDEGDDDGNSFNDEESEYRLQQLTQQLHLLPTDSPRINQRRSSDSSAVYGRLEHPLPSNRFRMQPQCLFDPPETALPSAGSKGFFSFNPAAQQCERLALPKETELAVGPNANAFGNLRECQEQCCPTSFCRQTT